ncbi:uncharacterized protein LOC130798204 [Amaranthus tricolor]|uniref:uncharacterized protein LOC130798204 n=1 Tax=Amaranthus tricolor TaxID=29722 RepID=UPI00258E70D0|nr:uncharacterized protein LOC130798204 [Amaranthus tricolor]
MTCITSTSYVLMLNSNPTPIFSAKRGLRQGDPLSPLPFVIDDLMLFCKGNIFSIRALCNCILLFSQSSRLQANSAKSVIYTAGIPTDIREEFRTISQFACGYLPFKYLTVPFSSKRLSMVDCEQIVDKMTWRIRAWSAKNLSYDTFCKSKKAGGLGIRNLQAWNIAVLGKIACYISHLRESLWVRWVHGVY